MPDHVHMMLSIPPKYAVSQVVGFIKGKSAIHPKSGSYPVARSTGGGFGGPMTDAMRSLM